jgi:hypothetical protein
VLSLLSLEGPLHPHLDSSSSSFLVKPWLALCTTSAGECRRRGCCCCLLLGRDVTFGCFLFFWYSFSREKCRTLTVTCSARSALILIRRPARFLNTTMYGLRSSRNRFFSACFSSSLILIRAACFSSPYRSEITQPFASDSSPPVRHHCLLFKSRHRKRRPIRPTISSGFSGLPSVVALSVPWCVCCTVVSQSDL